MPKDLYIWFQLIAASALGIALMYIFYKRFIIAIGFFIITPLFSALMYTNKEEWINVEVATGLQGYLRAGILLSLGLVGIFYFITHWNQHKDKLPVHFIVLGIFLLFALISISYSVDRRYTTIRAFLFLATSGFLLGLHTWLDNKKKFEQLFNLLFYYVLILSLLTLFFVVFEPSRAWWWKEPSRLLGIWDHPAVLGAFCMISYPILIWKFTKVGWKGKGLIGLLLIITFLFHVASGSRTTLGTSMFGFILWLIISKKFKELIVASVLVSIFFIGIATSAPASMRRDKSKGIFFLTERDLIWKGAIKIIEKSPLIGYGYRVEAKIFDDQKEYDISDLFFIATAQQPLHSGYISIAAGGGLVGLLLWLTLLTIPIYKSLHSNLTIEKGTVALIMIMLMITNLTETALTGYQSLTDIMFWIAWVIGGNIYKFDKDFTGSTIEDENENLKLTGELVDEKSIHPNYTG